MDNIKKNIEKISVEKMTEKIEETKPVPQSNFLISMLSITDGNDTYLLPQKRRIKSLPTKKGKYPKAKLNKPCPCGSKHKYKKCCFQK